MIDHELGGTQRFAKVNLASRAKSNYWVRTCYYLIDDARQRWRMRRGVVATASGTVHKHLDADESVKYIEEVFDDYRKYGKVERFTGKIAEIGPGDNCGVGLLFHQDGAAQVDLVDRFYSERDASHQSDIYQSLCNRHPELAASLSGSDFNDENTFPGIQRHYGENAACEKFFLERENYDFIVSRAVLEHVTDPVLALREMCRALRPGGRLLHKIDFRDHGMFSGGARELEFLRASSLVHHYMTQGSGRPNRYFVHEYRRVLEELPLDYEILVTRLVQIGEITPHVPFEKIADQKRQASVDAVRAQRSSFHRGFSGVSDEDLAVAGVFLVATRRADG